MSDSHLVLPCSRSLRLMGTSRELRCSHCGTDNNPPQCSCGESGSGVKRASLARERIALSAFCPRTLADWPAERELRCSVCAQDSLRTPYAKVHGASSLTTSRTGPNCCRCVRPVVMPGDGRVVAIPAGRRASSPVRTAGGLIPAPDAIKMRDRKQTCPIPRPQSPLAEGMGASLVSDRWVRDCS